MKNSPIIKIIIKKIKGQWVIILSVLLLFIILGFVAKSSHKPYTAQIKYPNLK